MSVGAEIAAFRHTMPRVKPTPSGGCILYLPRHAMIRKSKWIEIHSPDQSAAKVAARTLDGRLRLVAHYLPLAASAADDDDEHVHQTRVATRRAMTTLAIFQQYLPRKELNWFRKQLRRARKAANDARDFDVLADRLSERQETTGDDPTCGELIEWIHDRRRDAQKPIRAIARRFDKKHFKRRAKRLVKRLSKRRGKKNVADTFGHLALARMQELTDEFFAAEPRSLQNLDRLHRFRVCGKHLRYAMEVFAGAFRRTFRDDLYPQIEALQEQLGKINDHFVARGHYDRWLSEARDGARKALLRELIGEEETQLRHLHEQFLRDWTPERAVELHRRFVQVLRPDDDNRIAAVG
jgi:CHAD domain-containing protein